MKTRSRMGSVLTLFLFLLASGGKSACARGAEGDLVGMVSFRYPGDELSTVTPMISVSVYLTVAGTEHRAGQINEVVVRRYPAGLLIGADVKATGNVHLRPSGRVILE